MGLYQDFEFILVGRTDQDLIMEAIKKQATKLREQVAKQQQVSVFIFVFLVYLVGEVTFY